MSGVTAGTVLDMARMRHPLFVQAQAPDGAILQQMDARQRTLVLMYSGAVDGLVNTTVSLALVFAGALVGQSAGVPQYGTTYSDGWPVQQTNDGVPFVDFRGPAIAGDPFGAHGGVPGFPLPADFLKLVLCWAVLNDNRQLPIDIIAEVQRLERQRLARLTAFVSGNRLVPVRALAANNAADMWSLPITSLQLSYVALPTVRAVTDAIMLPAALIEALTADMAEFLAYTTPGVTAVEKANFAADARRAESAVGDYSLDVTGATNSHSVVFRR